MNMKKIILAATTLILASTLTTGFALDVDTNAVYISRNSTNALKLSMKRNQYVAAGIYETKAGDVGFWKANRCIEDKKSRQLSCAFKSSDRKGTITFNINNGRLSSQTVYNNKKHSTEVHSWRIAR